MVKGRIPEYTVEEEDTPSPFPTTNKIERGPKAPKPRTETEAFRFTPHSLLNKARPRALGRSAGSFPIVLFPPRERRTEEVCPARGGSVESFCCLSRELYDLFPYYLERYYESSVPDSIAAAIWFTGTTKKSHAYVTVTDGFIILDHEDAGRASGFHSHHHIDDKSPRALP
uniref:Uncharacterized protein n=1 Tax=Vitis vinifera TaxID=29760 RepID=F6HWW4_VITVI